MEPPSSQTAEEAPQTVEADEEVALNELLTIEIPPLPEQSPHAWNDVNEKQLRSALIGACKRMPRNAEAHFHLGLMYLRKNDGDEALHAFHHCRRIYAERFKQYEVNNVAPPPHLISLLARLRIHMAQAAHMAAQVSLPRDDRAILLERLQRDLLSASDMDPTQPDCWNALALLHLLEGGGNGAQQLLLALHTGFPEYLDALNNLGLAELSVGNVPAAISAMQKVLLYDRDHAESLTNYGILLLQSSLYPAAQRVLSSAVKLATCEKMAATWGALAVAHAAMGDLTAALEASEKAENMASSIQRARFALIHASIGARVAAKSLPDAEARGCLDAAILKLRALARELKCASAHAALALALRFRHDHANDETGNRNFGAEAAERLVEALELDESDGACWTQLALLQMWTGDYQACKEFSTQAVCRSNSLEAGWNCLAVASQMSDDLSGAERFYEKAVQVVLRGYRRRADGEREGDGEGEGEGEGDGEGEGEGEEDGEEEMTEWSEEEGGEVQLTAEEGALNKCGRGALAALYNNMAILRRQEGRSGYAEASRLLEKSLALGGENALVYNNVALLYVAAGRLRDAADMLRHALRLDNGLLCARSNQMKLSALVRQRQLELVSHL